MSNQTVSDRVESIRLDGVELDAVNPQLILRCGQRYKLEVFGRKDSPSHKGRYAITCSGGEDVRAIEVISSSLSDSENNAMELILMARDQAGSCKLELGEDGVEGALVIPVEVVVRGKIQSCRVYLQNGDVRAGGQGGFFIPVPVDEGDVSLLLEHEGLSGVYLAPQQPGIEFQPDVIGSGPLSTKIIMSQLGHFMVYCMYSGYIEATFQIESYKSWATFSGDGVNYGRFLPIMMEANKVYKISVHPLDPEDNGTVGTFYGIPDWMDVFPEQVTENFDVAHESVTIGTLQTQPIGGPGKSERYIRLKDSAPKGAIPVRFVFSDGKRSGGFVNLERI